MTVELFKLSNLVDATAEVLKPHIINSDMIVAALFILKTYLNIQISLRKSLTHAIKTTQKGRNLTILSNKTAFLTKIVYLEDINNG